MFDCKPAASYRIHTTIHGRYCAYEENILVKAYKRRKCGRKKIDENYERIPIYHDIPESEKICGCGAKLVKVGEKVTERV
ncbi:MAG: hypothetical protein II032_06240, partial [Treponema sp.]|nr:hypothetical protein [Treponema sp.]